MGTLTTYLQREFARCCPAGWAMRSEVPLLPAEVADLLGYAPRADVVLRRADGSRRLWIEFEVSRADPVANHAKFATAHLFHPQAPGDSFVSMVSPHVTRGRRNLAANTVALMRQVGMSAFQTVLFPQLLGPEVQRLNHLDSAHGQTGFPAVQPEVDRALAISEPVISSAQHRVYLAGEMLEVLLNVRQWNDELAAGAGRALWGSRTVTYFVFDPRAATFAPAKYCAYLPLDRDLPGEEPLHRSVMTTRMYTALDGADTRFDGHRAQIHLTRALAMRPVPTETVEPQFGDWLCRHDQAIRVHTGGAKILVPPPWFM